MSAYHHATEICKAACVKNVGYGQSSDVVDIGQDIGIDNDGLWAEGRGSEGAIAGLEEAK
jgi:hypothetical protein